MVSSMEKVGVFGHWHMMKCAPAETGLGGKAEVIEIRGHTKIQSEGRKPKTSREVGIYVLSELENARHDVRAGVRGARSGRSERCGEE